MMMIAADDELPSHSKHSRVWPARSRYVGAEGGARELGTTLLGKVNSSLAPSLRRRDGAPRGRGCGWTETERPSVPCQSAGRCMQQVYASPSCWCSCVSTQL